MLYLCRCCLFLDCLVGWSVVLICLIGSLVVLVFGFSCVCGFLCGFFCGIRQIFDIKWMCP